MKYLKELRGKNFLVGKAYIPGSPGFDCIATFWYYIDNYSSTAGYSGYSLINANGTKIKENEEIVERCLWIWQLGKSWLLVRE